MWTGRVAAILRNGGICTVHYIPFFVEQRNLGENRYELLPELYLDTISERVLNGMVRFFEREGSKGTPTFLLKERHPQDLHVGPMKYLLLEGELAGS